MRNFIWNIIAWIVTRDRITDWLLKRAFKTPYSHIMSACGSQLYMGRWWLFNPYRKDDDGGVLPARFSWLPSIRIHHIKRADQDRDLHDHPWNARTIVLRGWYEEERPTASTAPWITAEVAEKLVVVGSLLSGKYEIRDIFKRDRGYTGRLLFGQYHRISEVNASGVWTMFITWGYAGDWGFLVDGEKVPHREYLEREGADHA